MSLNNRYTPTSSQWGKHYELGSLCDFHVCLCNKQHKEHRGLQGWLGKYWIVPQETGILCRKYSLNLGCLLQLSRKLGSKVNKGNWNHRLNEYSENLPLHLGIKSRYAMHASTLLWQCILKHASFCNQSRQR